MTQILNTIVDRPIVNLAHYSSVLAANDAVKHSWTLVRNNRYSNPSPVAPEGPERIRPRKGTVPLVSTNTAAQWSGQRGAWVVAQFPDDPGTPTDNPNGKFIGNIPSPGPIFSVLLASNQPTADTQGAFGIKISDIADIEIQPARGATRSVRIGGSAPRDIGPAVPVNAWVFSAWVFDLTNGILAASTNGGEFTTTPLALPGFVPPVGPTALIRVGYSVTTRPFSNGMISDVSIVSGDVRNMPDLLAAGNYYNQTGYGA